MNPQFKTFRGNAYQNSSLQFIYCSQQIEHDLCFLQNTYNIPICMIGDFNARTAAVRDFLDIEPEIISITNISLVRGNNYPFTKESFVEMGIPMERHQQDTSTNDNGENLVELCRSSDLKIVKGRVGADQLYSTCLSIYYKLRFNA